MTDTIANLRPVRSKEEARERGRKGGIKSGQVRKANKTAQQIATMLINTKVTSEQTLKQLEKLGIERNDATLLTTMIAGMISKASKGDAKAFSTVMEYAGQSAKFNQEQSLKSAELSIKQRDIELREKQFEYQLARESGEVKEEDKVIIVNDLDKYRNGKEKGK